jgi:hypothetical protein
MSATPALFTGPLLYWLAIGCSPKHQLRRERYEIVLVHPASDQRLAACRRMLSFLRLRLGTRIGRLCLPTKLAAEPLEDHSQVEPGSE